MNRIRQILNNRFHLGSSLLEREYSLDHGLKMIKNLANSVREDEILLNSAFNPLDRIEDGKVYTPKTLLKVYLDTLQRCQIEDFELIACVEYEKDEVFNRLDAVLPHLHIILKTKKKYEEHLFMDEYINETFSKSRTCLTNPVQSVIGTAYYNTKQYSNQLIDKIKPILFHVKSKQKLDLFAIQQMVRSKQSFMKVKPLSIGWFDNFFCRMLLNSIGIIFYYDTS